MVTIYQVKATGEVSEALESSYKGKTRGIWLKNGYFYPCEELEFVKVHRFIFQDMGQETKPGRMSQPVIPQSVKGS